MRRPVLIAVDDDAVVLATVERHLAARFSDSYDVVTASSGAVGLNMLRRLKLGGASVVLLLVDQRMPGMSGVEFLSASRELFPDARRVILTDLPLIDSPSGGITAADIHCYLPKPWEPPQERLYPALEELLQGGGPTGEPAVPRIIGRGEQSGYEVAQFLSRNLVPHRQLDVEVDGTARELLALASVDDHELPAVVLGDGDVLVQPSLQQVAERVGLPVRTEKREFDLIVVGAGPAGLSASVVSALEGLTTLLLESTWPGGQAGTSTRIDNYLGFPDGLTGDELISRSREQAARAGVELLVAVEAVELRRGDGWLTVCCSDGTPYSARAVIVSTGVRWRRIGIPSLDALQGRGVFFGDAVTAAPATRGRNAIVLGAANSAGQAAIHLSRYADEVTLVTRGDTLNTSMSDHLIRSLEPIPNIRVRYHTMVVDGTGTEFLEAVTLRDIATGEEENVRGLLFIFLGAGPATKWVGGTLALDQWGFVLTGADVLAEAGTTSPWPLERPPFPLETSLPGVFAAGDVRHGSVKRMVSAVGEGGLVVPFVHAYLGSLVG